MRRIATWMLAALATLANASFTPEERREVSRYWHDRYAAEDAGPWTVRLTVEGSVWFYGYEGLRGNRKGAKPLARFDPSWEEWTKRRLAYDRALAQADAARRNGGVANAPAPPGPMPEGLAALLPEPPPLAAAVRPRRHRIRFDEGEWAYQDQVKLGPRSPYFRFAQGVMAAGRRVRDLSPDELSALVQEAGLTPQQVNVMRAVSLLEGGFDSVNTYDTGYLSVGLIQFAALKGGAGSLGQVLRRMKETNPAAFEESFRRYGVDVEPDGRLCVVDPDTGEEAVGPDAVLRIVEDKRLTAVFGRAGGRCRCFQVAQLQVARDLYFPADDAVKVRLGAETVTLRVGDVVRSEAGLATLMDRKVHTGRLGDLAGVVARVAADYGVNAPERLAELEAEIVRRMRHRTDFLTDATLAQPGPMPLLSRHGTRKLRSGGRP